MALLSIFQLGHVMNGWNQVGIVLVLTLISLPVLIILVLYVVRSVFDSYDFAQHSLLVLPRLLPLYFKSLTLSVDNCQHLCL
jgi:hypothetical protein